ncbi:hypothetical protein QBC40DRAFT_349368 [Triangularia verruculosa]|uniref:DUF1857-domain-containing protein n=1 Tax=Triangularia verruculosa TaxID=2587418 RepID=A0AAN6XG11_9PEZI|nr:hypothetical protein QBC40DRAFT_349368 [Triangularia verruculosa]
MVTINIAYTAPINRPGQTPLTTPQVWAGLVRKVRHAEEFVPAISSCTVDSESKNADGQAVITRYVNFGQAAPMPSSGGERGEVREVCTLFPPHRVDFVQDDGTKVWNYVSQGPGREGEDLYLTYVFEARDAGLVEGSEGAVDLEGRFKATAKKAVESSIETIRRLVGEGKL